MSPTPPWFVLPTKTSCESVVIVGAGLAGCHTAFELAQHNVQVKLVDAGNCIAAGASNNTAAIVKPFFTRTPDNATAFNTAAFNYLMERLEQSPTLREQAQFNNCGVLQLIVNDYPVSDHYKHCTPSQATKLAGVSIDNDALYVPNGGYLNPQALCKAIANHPNIDVQLNTFVSTIERQKSQWLLKVKQLDTNETSINCTTLILANGEQLNQFEQTNKLPITAARGQTSYFKTDSINPLQTVVTGKHYVIPATEHVIVGATFSRNRHDKSLQVCDHEQNFNNLTALLPSLNVKPKATSGFCGVRATTPDRLPIVGPVPDVAAYLQDYNRVKDGLAENSFSNARYHDNLYVIGGLGSRGVVCAPYCASLLAEQLCSTASNTMSTLLHPGRFFIRALKRNQPLELSKTL